MLPDKIEAKLTNKPKKLELKLKKKKGLPNFINVDSYEGVGEYYFEARNLEPFGDFKSPYWSIIEILEPTFIKSKYESDDFYHHYFYRETELIYKKYFPESLYSLLLMNIVPYNFEFYNKYLSESPKKVLFISNNYYQENLEEFFIYRENTSYYSSKDFVDYLVFNNFTVDETRRRDYKHVDELKSKNPNFNLIINTENICNNPDINYLDKKYDFIELNSQMFYWPLKKYVSYISSQFLFNCIIIAMKKISKNGILKIDLGQINFQIIFDILGIISYYFEDVYLEKGMVSLKTIYSKQIIAKKFKGISNTEYQKLLEISKSWSKIQKDCFAETKIIDENKYYVTSIIDFKGNLEEIKNFERKEDEMKINFFKKIVEAYYSIKNNGKEEIKRLIKKKIYQNILILESLGLYSEFDVNKIKRDILKENLTIDYELNLYKFFFNKKINDPIRIRKIGSNFDEIKKITNNLKTVKRILDDINPIIWEETSKKMKLFISLRNKLEKKYTFSPTSQGFVKMYEMLKIFDLLDKKKKNHETFHLCEAPGQFVLATNHYLKTETQNINFHWKAQSLVEKNALGDNYGLIKKYPDHWDFGVNGNGDIMNEKNLIYYSDQMSNVDLVTFDCGIDFDNKKMQTYQDEFTASLNYSQILIILKSLKLESCFVIKVFLPQTIGYIISLNYLLCCSFREFFMYKPIVNPQSSEVYLIGKGFRGFDQNKYQKLFDIRNKLNSDNLLINIPQEFLEQYKECIEKFINSNIETIVKFSYFSRNLELLSDSKKLDEIRKNNVFNWINYFGIKKIKKSDMLI